MTPIRLLVSDVDGTLVQPDKSLAPSTVAAAARVQAAGMALAIVSARPPRGMTWIAETLGLKAPLAGFNGGTLLAPDGTVISQQVVPEDAVRLGLDLFARRGVDAWLFTADEWLLTNPEGPRIDLERHTVRFNERVVPDLHPYAGQAGKIVGVSDDFAKLAAVEHELQELLGGAATAHRSQQYYLDVTHPDANKGNAVRALAATLGFDLQEVAVIGDMENDVPMFGVAGYAVAMGNATPAVQAKAAAVTGRNDADGWADAVDKLILPRGRIPGAAKGAAA